MKFTVATTACLVGCAIASPVEILTRDAPFTDDTCRFTTVVPPTPLGFLFPTASELGEIVGPVLKGLIGDAALEDIDTIGDTLCMYVTTPLQTTPSSYLHWNVEDMLTQQHSNSQEETSGGTGICAQVLQTVKDIANEAVPETQAAKYKCLLNLLCV